MRDPWCDSCQLGRGAVFPALPLGSVVRLLSPLSPAPSSSAGTMDERLPKLPLLSSCTTSPGQSPRSSGTDDSRGGKTHTTTPTPSTNIHPPSTHQISVTKQYRSTKGSIHFQWQKTRKQFRNCSSVHNKMCWSDADSNL